jgi:hypothetical protein
MPAQGCWTEADFLRIMDRLKAVLPKVYNYMMGTDANEWAYYTSMGLNIKIG